MKIALIGYGKMGKTIEQVILEKHTGDEIVLRIGEENLDELTIANLQKADVAIEFTRPDAAIGNIYACFEASIPVVVGTTGWLNLLPEVSKTCDKKGGALFYSPNYSIGVNIFFEINRKLAALMNSQPQYEVQIEEIHHTEKLDAPSGTAIRAAEMILVELNHKTAWRLNEAKDDRKLQITALREPNVPGTHSVVYSSAVDEIRLVHQAKNRRGFAEGAVLAAHWLVGKQGVFEMKDLLRW